MIDPEELQDHASNIVLHAWIMVYIGQRGARADSNRAVVSNDIQIQAIKLRESAIQLQAALEKMRIANEKLALRMAEHKAFFAKFQTPRQP